MIVVSDDKVAQVEYLLWQSSLGNHLLFEPQWIREVFHYYEKTPFTEQDAYSVEHHIERIIEQPTFWQKRAYLEKLDHEIFRRVVRTYFNIVENNIYEHLEIKQ